MSKITGTQLERLRDDVRKMRGYPPYNEPSNICVGDGYFGASLEKKWQMSYKDLLRVANLDSDGRAINN